jgi:tripeptidyl-peptidase-1
VPLAQENTLLGASYQLYRHKETRETIPRTIGYALPAALHGLRVVLTVAPTTRFASPRSLWQTSPVSSLNGAALDETQSELVSGAGAFHACSKLATPEYLRRLYISSGDLASVTGLPTKMMERIACISCRHSPHRVSLRSFFYSTTDARGFI